MKDKILIQKILEEFDEAWDQFVEKIVRIQNKYKIGFVPMNSDAWLNPSLCYKIKEIIKERKKSVKYFVISFDSDKIKHNVASGKEILLDKKGETRGERWLFKKGKIGF